jgi:PadR family transcriptional regulator PadR
VFDVNPQFKKGVVEMCILSIINQEDKYGFEVIDLLSKEIDVNENTVYPILRRLTQQGLFETYEKTTTMGAPRKYYKITNKGIEKFKNYEKEWKTFLMSVFKILGGNKNEE